MTRSITCTIVAMQADPPGVRLELVVGGAPAQLVEVPMPTEDLLVFADLLGRPLATHMPRKRAPKRWPADVAACASCGCVRCSKQYGAHGMCSSCYTKDWRKRGSATTATPAPTTPAPTTTTAPAGPLCKVCTCRTAGESGACETCNLLGPRERGPVRRVAVLGDGELVRMLVRKLGLGWVADLLIEDEAKVQKMADGELPLRAAQRVDLLLAWLARTAPPVGAHG